MTRHGEHHRDGVFGGGDHVAERRVHDDHTFFRCGVFVDVVGADTGAGDNLEVGRVGEDRFGYFGRRADGKAIIIADDSGQFFFVFAQVGLEVDFDAAVFEDLNGGFGQAVGNENFGGHDWRSFMR